ncbi:LON peptidase substrate-binding domain-containing protein [bacterium]|nr:LON peptidase substrate-binding domain-containing protein [bacterium]MBU1072000.1 LON peptidase substrate-binding domain-containing protein [bacterium]MBU1676923.1 LON peptidase substrate-binding domain-containing protein [bacterium]
MNSSGITRIVGVPMFPLPDYYLFPGALVPLHIFEPRYRQMISDLLDTAGRLVVGTIRAQDAQTAYGPSVFAIGGLGEIVSHRRLDDGRYLIWLLGLERVRLKEIDSDRLYRRVDATVLPDEVGNEQRNAELAPRLRAAIEKRMLPGIELSASLGAGLLADILHQHLPLSIAQKDWVLAQRNVTRRAEAALAWLDGIADEAEA